MSFLKNNEHRARPTHTLPICIASNRHFKQEIEHNADGEVCRGRWYSTEIQNRYWSLATKPLLYDSYQWVWSLGCSNRFLEEL
jgi:hypothetical protein